MILQKGYMGQQKERQKGDLPRQVYGTAEEVYVTIGGCLRLILVQAYGTQKGKDAGWKTAVIQVGKRTENNKKVTIFGGAEGAMGLWDDVRRLCRWGYGTMEGPL